MKTEYVTIGEGHACFKALGPVEDGKWRVMEGHGSYRMLRKKFRNRDAAIAEAQRLSDLSGN